MVEKIDFKGVKAAKISNSKKDEIILLYGIGPRIISFKPEGKDNFFYVKEDDFKNTKANEWKIYGGTRLWTSVESKWSYLPDNEECDIDMDNSYIKITTPTDPVTQLQKSIEVKPIKDTFKITYSIKNNGKYLINSGIWALSCISPSKSAEIYLPWGENSSWNVKDMKYWRSWITSKSDIESSQWKPTNEFFIIRPTGECGKVGFANRWGFAIFKNDSINFVKVSEYIEGAVYPDDGCSFESYTSEDFYELETLSPIFTMKPGVTYSHSELWWAGTKNITTKTIGESYQEVRKLFS